MKTITLSNLPWRAWSPSLFELVDADDRIDHEARLTIAYDGNAWLVGINGGYGSVEHPTRDAAAAMVAKAFSTAQNWETGA